MFAALMLVLCGVAILVAVAVLVLSSLDAGPGSEDQ